MTGTIMRSELGFKITVAGFETVTYDRHTLHEAMRRYRKQHKLIGKKIVWRGELACYI